MSRSAILLKVGLVNFVFFQLRNEGIHSSGTIPLGVFEKPSKLLYFCVFLYCNRQVHRDFLITLYEAGGKMGVFWGVLWDVYAASS